MEVNLPALEILKLPSHFNQKPIYWIHVFDTQRLFKESKFCFGGILIFLWGMPFSFPHSIFQCSKGSAADSHLNWHCNWMCPILRYYLGALIWQAPHYVQTPPQKLYHYISIRKGYFTVRQVLFTFWPQYVNFKGLLPLKKAYFRLTIDPPSHGMKVTRFEYPSCPEATHSLCLNLRGFNREIT